MTLKRPPQPPVLNPAERLYDVVEQEIHVMDAELQNLVWMYRFIF